MQRIVVVTGSSGGIGSAIRERFTALGDTVVGIDLAAELAGDHRVDITDAAQCEAVVQRIIDQHGRVDVLCNNAGVSAVGDVVASTPDDWQRVFAVNVFGTANMSRAALPHMRRQQGGAIVNTCSIVATVGLVQRAVYASSKGAVVALTKAMAADEVANGIRVNAVAPGFVYTRLWQQMLPSREMFEAMVGAAVPMADEQTPAQIADAVAFLCSGRAAQVTGQVIAIDGGSMLGRPR